MITFMKYLLVFMFVVWAVAFCIHDFTLLDALVDFFIGGFLGFSVASFVHDRRW